MSAFHRIVLSKEDFAMLVQGKTVSCKELTIVASSGLIIEIALADIGFVPMLQEIGKAQDLGATQLAPC